MPYIKQTPRSHCGLGRVLASPGLTGLMPEPSPHFRANPACPQGVGKADPTIILYCVPALKLGAVWLTEEEEVGE